jgi:hypothetical protein
VVCETGNRGSGSGDAPRDMACPREKGAAYKSEIKSSGIWGGAAMAGGEIWGTGVRGLKEWNTLF